MAVYLSRSNPASRVAEWSLAEVQSDTIKRTKRQRVVSHSLLNQTVEHRAVQQQASAKDNRVMDCTSVGVLDSPVVMWTDQGESCPVVQTFLLLGLEDGRILFMDPLEKSLQHLEFTVGKDAVLEVRHDRLYNCLITKCKAKNAAYVSVWDLPTLQLRHEVFCPSDIVGFARLSESMITGHSSGHVFVQSLLPTVDNGPNTPRAAPTIPSNLLKHRPKPDHLTNLVAVDSCPAHSIYCSVSQDGVLKLWNSAQILLSEILLEEEISAACFLNSFGDIVLSMKNHLFIMSHKKMSPGCIDGEEIRSVSDIAESEIIEDPAVKYEGIVEDPDPIDLDSYLCPFRAELSLEYLEQKMHQREEEEEEEEETETEGSITESFLSSDLALLSPLESSLGGEISDMETASLENWTKVPHGHKRTRDRYEYQMPEFGISPEPTPQPSEASEEERSETPKLVEEKEASEGHVSADDERETQPVEKDTKPKPSESSQKPTETSVPPRRRFAEQLSAVRIDANDIPARGVRKAVGVAGREPLKMAPTSPALTVKETPGRERKVRNRAAVSGGRRSRKKSSSEKKFAPKGEDFSAKGRGKAPTLTKGDIGEAGGMRGGRMRTRKGGFSLGKLNETFSDTPEEDSEEELKDEDSVITDKPEDRSRDPAPPRTSAGISRPIRRGRAPFASSNSDANRASSAAHPEEEGEGGKTSGDQAPSDPQIDPPRPRTFTAPQPPPPPRPPSTRRSSAELSVSLDDFLRVSDRPPGRPSLKSLPPEELLLAFEKYADSLSDHPYYKFQSLQHPDFRVGSKASSWLRGAEGQSVTPGFDLNESINRLHRGSRSGCYRPLSAYEFERGFDGTASALLRPRTAQISALEEWASEEEYFQKVQEAYNNLLLRYQSARPETPASKIFHNDGLQAMPPDTIIERHFMLRLRRLLRHQSAADRRHSACAEKEERRRAMLGHRFCAHEPTEEEEISMPPPRAFSSARERSDRSRGLRGSRLASAPPPKVGGDQKPKAPAPSTPYRISLSSAPALSDEKLYDLKSKDELKAALHLKYSAPSIPSKCSRYTLVSYPEEEHDIFPPTIMEERLIRNRFPQFKDVWIGENALLEPKPWMNLMKNSSSPRP